MSLRIGFIGIGAMGLSHLKALHLDSGGRSQAVAICSSNEANIKKALAIAPNVRVYAKESDLIASELDAVVVSSPNFTHVALADEIVRSGRHLFLEKPCGITRDECARLVEISDRARTVLMIGHELRYSPYFQRMKALAASGDIGTPRMVWTREFRGPFQRKSGQWIQDDRKSGGCLVDKNCHHFDVMNSWVGSRPRRVAAFGSNAVNRVIEGPNQVHDHATVNFEYENGVRGTLQLCMFARDFPHEDLEMGIVGDLGMLQTRISGIEILQWKRGNGSADPIVHKVQDKIGEGWGGHLGFAQIHEAFLEAMLEGKRPLTTVRDCVDGTLLAIAAEESIRTGAIVSL